MDPELLRHIHNIVAHINDMSSQADPKRVMLQDCSDEEIRERCNNASQLGLVFETGNAVEAGCQGTTMPILVAAGRARPNAPDRALVDIRITCTTIVIIVIIISCR